MAINTLADWRQNGAHARQSILGRPRRKEAGREPGREEEDEVQRSPATEHHIQTFLDALQAGDTAEQSHALAKIVDTWRADNNAGGLPVYAHPPLPSGFANELAKVVRNAPDAGGKSAEHGIAARLEPGARLSVLQQLRNAASNSRDVTQLDNEPPVADITRAHENARLGEDRNDNVASRHAPLDALRARTLEYRPDRDGPSDPQTLPWDGRRPEATPVQGMPLGSATPLLPQSQDIEDEAEAPWIPMPTVQGSGVGGPVVRRQVARIPRPKPVTVPGARPGFQPDDWYSDTGARTSAKKVLISVGELSPTQQQNLHRRRWLHPTGVGHGNRILKQGLGYFGASRGSTNSTTKVTKIGSHGGLDCPGDVVRMPTDAELISVQESFGTTTDSNGKKVPMSLGYTLTFDLGDGLQLSLLHVKPSRRVLDLQTQLANPHGRFVRSTRFRMGEDLGRVDHQAYLGKNDHTHLQITAEGGDYNGQHVDGFAVDPTYLVERDGVPIAPRDDAYSDDGGYWEELKKLIPRFQP